MDFCLLITVWSTGLVEHGVRCFATKTEQTQYIVHMAKEEKRDWMVWHTDAATLRLWYGEAYLEVKHE